MAEQLHARILSHLKSDRYRPQKPQRLAHELEVREEQYHAFRDALRDLMHEGRVVLGAKGTVLLPTQALGRNEVLGSFRQNRRGFGFVVPTDPASHEDLYIPQGENGGAMTGDIVRAQISSRGQRDGRTLFTGRIVEVISRTNKRFVGTLVKQGAIWSVMPDGNALTEPILTPDAAARHVKPGSKVVVELTVYPGEQQPPQGVITDVLGKAGEKDVDLKSVIVQFNLPEAFGGEVTDQAREAVDSFRPGQEVRGRLDLTKETIVTIDPEDAKDYDDAISLKQVEGGYWELGVHIADVSWFVPVGTPLDVEARARGNSSYFPGYVIPMLPEILSNGVCSLQEGVPRLCKSAFITFDEDAQPVRTRFANTIIQSTRRLRYREAQAIIDRAEEVPHPEGSRTVRDYPAKVVELLDQMNALARRLQKRRQHEGQLVLELPEVELVLDEEGKVVDAVPEDQSFTHTLIEMFMVEANEAVARLLDSLGVPFLRRTHADPDLADLERLRQFISVAGHRVPKEMDRKAIQHLLAQVRGKPESFALNLAVLKSLARAEYSPQPIGHFALASKHYCHFTSPIRRYADLTIHRLLDAYFTAVGSGQPAAGGGGRRKQRKVELENVPSYDELVELGRHISFTERRSDDAERELRKVKILTLLEQHLGEDFLGVITGITSFGIFVQIQTYLIDGLIRYENLMDDWWDVDERSGSIRGQRSGTVIRIGDVVKVVVARVDLPRRELDLGITEVRGRTPQQRPGQKAPEKAEKPKKVAKHAPRGGGHPRHSRPDKGRRRGR